MRWPGVGDATAPAGVRALGCGPDSSATHDRRTEAGADGDYADAVAAATVRGLDSGQTPSGVPVGRGRGLTAAHLPRSINRKLPL